MFGRKEKENGTVNWEERVKPSEAVEAAEAAAENEERPAAKLGAKDLSPKKIFEMVKALAESAQLEDEETWAEVKEKSRRAAGAFARLQSTLQSALEVSKEARAALEELTARVGARRCIEICFSG
jgi:predicted AAA+ superfamily ATPase